MVKNIFKSDVAKMVSALVIVGIISGTSLVFVYGYAMPRIEANIARETEVAIGNIFPDVASVKTIAEENIFQVKDTGGNLLGYAFTAEGNGYQGVIKLIVGIDSEGIKLRGVEVLESQETPGLGAEIASESFKEQFTERSIVRSIEYVKNQKAEEEYQIEAITGATISSGAVVSILNKRIGKVREVLK